MLGRHDDAAEHFETALSDCERYGLRPQLAISRLQYAQLLSQGNAAARVRARGMLEQCLADATRMGMTPLVAQAEQLQNTL